MSRQEKENDFYKYDPSKILAAVTAVLFALSSIYHVFQIFRKRTWYFIPFLCGCLLETIGYGARAVNAAKTPDWALIVYIIETLFILLAPALLAASIYMVLGRIVQLLEAGRLSMVPPKWLTKLFVTGDVLSFVTQLAGGGILAGSDDKKGNDLGQTVILVGLAIQIFFFSFFVIVTIIFHQRIQRDPTPMSSDSAIPWRTSIYVLYAASALILIRSVFRVIEYAMGKDGVLMSNEVYIYIFDALLVFTCVVIFNAWHPSRVVSMYNRLKASNDVEMSGMTVQRRSR